MTKKLIVVDSISKQFENIRAVDRLSFDVNAGEIFALLGPNGAGKTSVVRMLLNIIEPDSGMIRYQLNGVERTDIPRKDVGYLPEERGLYREVPINRTLAFMGVLRGMTHAEASRSADQWLDKVGLLDRKQEKLDHLSKGNQQKIQFIASVLHRPTFAILDEPFSGLDPVNQELFLDLISDLRNSGMTVLLSAHQMDLVQRLVDRVLLINKGRVVLEGTIPQLLSRSATSKTVILKIDGSPGEPFEEVDHTETLSGGEISFSLKQGVSVSSFLQKASSRLKIVDIRSSDPTLHEIFLQSVRQGSPEKAGSAKP